MQKKIKVKKDFYGAEDGINTKLYKANEIIEVDIEFAEIIIDRYAEEYNEKETKVDDPDETKEDKETGEESKENKEPDKKPSKEDKNKKQ